MSDFLNVFNSPAIIVIVLFPCFFIVLSLFQKDKTSKIILWVLAFISFVFFVNLRMEIVEYMDDPEIAVFTGEYVDTYKSGRTTYCIFIDSEGEQIGFTKEKIRIANDNTYPVKGRWYVIEYAVDAPLEMIINVEETISPEHEEFSGEE
ncbi:MAG: hypothetical protein IJ306_00120 [Oscillospiraceae bacterium]|nr:hypothetical protein [Oscillospiraceae bacterium]